MAPSSRGSKCALLEPMARRRTGAVFGSRPAFTAPWALAMRNLPVLSRRLCLRRHFRAALLEEVAHARFRLLVVLGDRRHQRFDKITGGAVTVGDTRQRLYQGEIGAAGVAGDGLGEFDPFGHSLTVRDDIMREAELIAFFGAIDPASQHHLHHPRGADETRQPHRAAAADEETALTLWKPIEGGLFGDAHMGRRGKLQAAADDSALQHGDNGHAAEFNRFEGAVPHAGMVDAAFEVLFGEFGEIEAGGEMVTRAIQYRRLDARRQIAERGLQGKYGFVVERVAFGGSVEAHERNLPIDFRRNGRWRFCRANSGHDRVSTYCYLV